MHGQLKTRGARLTGLVVSGKAKKTAIVKIDYTIYTYKYERYLRKHSRVMAHNPECINAKPGDIVSMARDKEAQQDKDVRDNRNSQAKGVMDEGTFYKNN